MIRSVACLFALLCLACPAHRALAQDLSPRAYVVLPVDANAVNTTYSHLEGGLQFDGSVPITDATANANLGILNFYHTFDLLGRSANVSLGLPYGVGNFYGTVVDVPKTVYRSGLLDPVGRISVNLLGGPAMTPAEFSHWQQDTLLGMSLTVKAPTGQYQPTKLVNWGNNQWGFEPELGYSQRLRHWLIDAYLGGWFFTKNDAFYPGTATRSEGPVGEFEAHLSYDFRPRLWVSLDANFWWGGVTTTNGVANPLTNQKNSRVGMTAAIPLTAHQSLKFQFSEGAYISYGGNYRSFSLSWQYGWIGTKWR
jgi:hypothetical protein